MLLYVQHATRLPEKTLPRACALDVGCRAQIRGKLLSTRIYPPFIATPPPTSSTKQASRFVYFRFVLPQTTVLPAKENANISFDASWENIPPAPWQLKLLRSGDSGARLSERWVYFLPV